MTRRSHRSPGTARDYPRTARLNHLLQEIIAEEIERLDDERLGLLTVVAVDVDPDLRQAIVSYTALAVPGPAEPGEAGGDGPVVPEGVAQALAEHRGRLQTAIARQARLKRTPELVFEPDQHIRQAERVEQILRELAADRPAATGPAADEPGARDQ